MARTRRTVRGAIQVSCNEPPRLPFDHRESLFGERRMDFIVGQQLDAAGEVLLQHSDGEAVTCALLGGNIVQRLLKRNSVHRLRSIGKKPGKKLGDALLARRSL